MLPDRLYHYYEKSRGPFLSISELSFDEFTKLMNDLATQKTPENRFDESWKRDFYIQFRPYVERTIRNRFIEKGGKPVTDAPRYFTLGPATWFLDWYEEPRFLDIALAEIPSDSISFTFPDSMMSYLIAEDRYEPFAKYKMPYHGEVYRLEEVEQLVKEYGMPDETDSINLEYGNRIVEAQVWDLDILRRFSSAPPHRHQILLRSVLGDL